jgi:glycosyltransferase involved in cell wall biosynthesis
MKIVLFISNYHPHIKNYEGIQRMCTACNIEFEISHSIERLTENNYDILISMNSYVDYNLIPENIKIIYGPQFYVFPEGGDLIGPLEEHTKGRIVFNCLSDWNIKCYTEFAPDFKVLMDAFPFAVNTEKFKPSTQDSPKKWDCVVYIKHRKQHIINETINILNSKAINFITITYGSYNESDYINALHNCKFMLTLDAHESQGFALEEAMSCNVPLLVVDAQSMYDETNDGVTSIYAHHSPKKLLATSVPYWSDECGIKVKDTSELSDAVDRMLATYESFTPRKYIEETLSDRVCMQRILDYFKL